MSHCATPKDFRITPASALLISAITFLVAVILIYFPAQIFLNNQEVFSESFLSLIWISGAFVLCTIFAAWIVGAFLPPRAVRIAGAVVAALAVWAFLLGGFISPLTVDMGLIDGEDAKISISPYYAFADILLLGALIAAIIFRLERLQSFLINGFVMGSVFIVMYAGYASLFGHKGRSNEHTQTGEIAAIDANNFFAVSDTENIFIILLDGFDSEYMDMLLAEDPLLETMLDGFTFFRDAAAVAPTTVGAMPAIHSGRMIMYDRPLAESYGELIQNGSFLSQTASDADVMLINSIRQVCPRWIACGSRDDLSGKYLGAAFDKWRVLAAISALRSAPHFMKPLLFNPTAWFGMLTPQAVDADVLPSMARNMTVTASRPQVRFLHLINTHTPYNMDYNCRRETTANGASQGRALNVMRCAMHGVASFFDALKMHGVYDQSLIVIFADHGKISQHANLRPIKHVKEIRVTRNNQFHLFRNSPLNRDHRGARAPRSSHPLFLVKPRRARGLLEQNSANAVSLVDLPATVCAHTRLCTVRNAYNAFEAPTAGERVREFYDYSQRPFLNAFRTHVPVSEVATAISIDYSLASAQAKESYDFVEAFPFSRGGMLPGFSFPERWGRWSAGKRAGFDLCFDERPRAEQDLVVKARAYLVRPGQRQRVKARVNGRIAFNETYHYDNPAHRRPLELRLTLTPSDFDADGCAALEFETPDAVPAPATWRDAGQRRIAIGLIEMSLEEQDVERAN